MRQRIFILMCVDIAIILFSAALAAALAVRGGAASASVFEFALFAALSVLFVTASMVYFKMYRRMWRYASIDELLALIKAVTAGLCVSYLLISFYMGEWFPLPAALMTYESALLLIGGSRFTWRKLRDYYINQQKPARRRRALIVGAGNCGMLIAKEMKQNPKAGMEPILFLDDDERKQKLEIQGLPVYGTTDQIQEAVESYFIDDIIIAMPSVSRKEISRIIKQCKTTGAKLKIVPNIGELINGKVSIEEMRDVEVEDLLGRDPVKVDLKGIADYVTDKTVLVTGAGGSIGSELCRQICPFAPKKLLLLGHGENSIFQIETELRRTFSDVPFETIIADVQDRDRMHAIFQTHRPEVVFHAAAHKHVPLMEKDPAEAIKNNVFGTKNVADAANAYKCERFVLISSDKAVNPTSVMGTTKRLAEMYVQSLSAESETIFASVRFGNVLGSRGSVIPYFKEQIKRGGPVTVTHPEMVRYFMTIPEAVQLVIQAGAFAKGGEVFVLDMGEPVKILDLAQDLIRLSGFEPGKDIEIVFTGMRPGEKLYEELLTAEEGLTSTKHNRIFIGKPECITPEEMEVALTSLLHELDSEPDQIRNTLKKLVPTYQWTIKSKPAPAAQPSNVLARA